MNLEVAQLPVRPEERAAMFAKEMDGLSFRYDEISMPSSGGLAFTLPYAGPNEPKTAEHLTGVILYHYPHNGYWTKKYAGAKERPQCSSRDGKIGNGDPGGNCITCPHNQYGSGKNGRGKACKNMRKVYFLKEGDHLATVLDLPSTSLTNFGDYIAKRVLGRGKFSFGVMTKISLEQAENGDGTPYSRATFATMRDLDEAEQREMYHMSLTAEEYDKREASNEIKDEYDENGSTIVQAAPMDSDNIPFPGDQDAPGSKAPSPQVGATEEAW